MKLGIRAKLFLISLGLIALALAIGYGYMTKVLDGVLTSRIRSDVEVRLDLLTRLTEQAELTQADTAKWTALAQNLARLTRARITFIDDRGEVLGDSDVAELALQKLDSHADRPEIIAARISGRGSSTRYSHTLNQRMHYVAASFTNQRSGVHGIVRIALPLFEVDRALTRLHVSLLLAGLLALSVAGVMSSVAAHFAARSVRSLTATARRMVQGELGMRTTPAGHDEVATLGRDLDGLADRLSSALGQLLKERDLLNGILSGMREGVLLIDERGQVRLCNPALRELLLLPAEVTGKPLPAEVSGNPELRGILERARTSPTLVAGEISLEGMRPLRLLVQAARMAEDTGGLLVVFVDVTDLRRLESLRRDFVANASHELRTPVTALRSAAETLRIAAMRDPEAAQRFLDIIDRNAERLQRMVEDLLDLSRIESHQFRLNPVVVVPAEFADRMIEMFQTRAEEKRIQMSIDMPAELPKVWVDPRALEQVLVNLIDNAIKYCPPGAHITLGATALSPRWVRVFVSDNGPGIEAKHLPRLFERFYRVDAGRSRELGGTGLGLAIVKHLIEAMDGEVSVESEVGKGATFSFTLPRADSVTAPIATTGLLP